MNARMQKHIYIIFIALLASLQALAGTFNPSAAFSAKQQDFQLHWELPTSLAKLQPQLDMMADVATPAEMPVSIMCQKQTGKWSVEPQATDVAGEERYWTVKRDLTLSSVPYIALGIAAHAIKRDVRKVNNDINSGFHNKADDYIQYAPLALTWGLKAAGYKGRSQWGRLLASNAMSAAIMAGLVNCLKYTIAEKRPDGSTSNSFPSGHTATAFMAATILHKEYGLTRSLWFSFGGYAVATGIGAFRVMNNRHWVSDVLTGAGIGILSTELGYALSDLIFKDKYTLRREMENLNDLIEHPSFFSLQAGAGFALGSRGVPAEIRAAGGPGSIKHGTSSVIGAEAAYFINPYLGFGVRARINSTAVTPRWNGIDDIWTSGIQKYNPTTNQYERPSTTDPSYRHGNSTNKDQLSGFDVMGGVYGSLPLNKRMSLGTKLLFGHRQSGDIWFWADKSGNDDDIETFFKEYLQEMTKVDELKDINTYDRVQAIDLEGKGSFIFGTGVSFSYALKHNVVWRIGLDYDFTRIRYDYQYSTFSLVDEANHYLRMGAEKEDLVSGQEAVGSFRRSLHQLTPHFGICFSF